MGQREVRRRFAALGRGAVFLLAVLVAAVAGSGVASSSSGDGLIAFSATSGPALDLVGRLQLFRIKASGGKPVSFTRHPAKLPRFVDAVPSPDRKLLAFVAQRGRHPDLFVMRPDGTGIRALTNTAAVEADPSWSPDGRSIAVTLVDGTEINNSHIALVSARGGSERIVAGGGLEPRFSPDGRTLLYVGEVMYNNPTGIHVVAASGGPAKLVALGSTPSWAHDSKRIAFVDPKGQLSILNLKTGATRRVLGTGSLTVPPLWSPDDRVLAVSTGLMLSLVHVGSGHVEREVHAAEPLAWSKDGSKLAVRRFGKRLAVLLVSSGHVSGLTTVKPDGAIVRAWWLGPNELAFGLTQVQGPLALFTIRPDGRGLKQLTHGSEASLDPAWSPDGQSIAFTRSDPLTGRSTIWKVDVTGENLRQLTPWTKGVRDSQPDWSPDGLRIAFVRNSGDDQGSALMVMADDGSLSTKVGFDPVAAPRSAPSWAADGKQIAWNRAVYAADGSGSQAIDASASDVWAPTFSPDGTELAYMRYQDLNGSDPQLMQRNLKTGELKLLTTKPSPYGPVYSPDSTQLGFVSQPGGSGSWGVSVVSTGGGDQRALLATGVDIESGFLAAPSWSPDSQHLVVPAFSDTTNLVIVDTVPTLPREIGFGTGETVEAVWQPVPS